MAPAKGGKGGKREAASLEQPGDEPEGEDGNSKEIHASNRAEGKGTFKTASGELINNYGPVKIGGYDMNGVKRIVNGSATDVHKVLISAGKLHGRGHSAWLWKASPSRWIAPCMRMDKAFDQVVEEYDDKGMISVVEENGIYNFYLELEGDESSEEQIAGAEEYVQAKGSKSEGGAQHGLGAGGEVKVPHESPEELGGSTCSRKMETATAGEELV